MKPGSGSGRPLRSGHPRVMAWLPASFFGVACSLLFACEPADQSPVGRGRRIFQRSCSGCHGVTGRGVRRRGLDRKPRDLTEPEFHQKMTDAMLRQSIRLGKGQMPAFGVLMSEQDLDHVIAFVRTLNPDRPAQPVSQVPP